MLSLQNMIPNGQVRSDNVRSMTKMRQNNDVNNSTGPLYAENENELSWLIRQGTVYDKDQTEKWRDWL